MNAQGACKALGLVLLLSLPRSAVAFDNGDVDVARVADCRCWAAQGQCQENPAFMKKQCPASCSRQRSCETSAHAISTLTSRVAECEIEVRHLNSEIESEKAHDDTVGSERIAILQLKVAELELKVAQANESFESNPTTPSLDVKNALAAGLVDSTCSPAQSSDRRADIVQNTALTVPGSALPQMSELQLKINQTETQVMELRLAVHDAANRSQEFEALAVELEARLQKKELASERLQRTLKQLEEEIVHAKATEHLAEKQNEALQTLVADLEAELSRQQFTNKMMANGSRCSLKLERENSLLEVELQRAREVAVMHAQKIADLMRSNQMQSITTNNASMVGSPRVAELEVRILELESELRRLVSETKTPRGSHAVDPWLQMYEALLHLPGDIRNWVTDLPDLAEATRLRIGEDAHDIVHDAIGNAMQIRPRVAFVGGAYFAVVQEFLQWTLPCAPKIKMAIFCLFPFAAIFCAYIGRRQRGDPPSLDTNIPVQAIRDDADHADALTVRRLRRRELQEQHALQALRQMTSFRCQVLEALSSELRAPCPDASEPVVAVDNLKEALADEAEERDDYQDVQMLRGRKRPTPLLDLDAESAIELSGQIAPVQSGTQCQTRPDKVVERANEVERMYNNGLAYAMCFGFFTCAACVFYWIRPVGQKQWHEAVNAIGAQSLERIVAHGWYFTSLEADAVADVHAGLLGASLAITILLALGVDVARYSWRQHLMTVEASALDTEAESAPENPSHPVKSPDACGFTVVADANPAAIEACVWDGPLVGDALSVKQLVFEFESRIIKAAPDNEVSEQCPIFDMAAEDEHDQAMVVEEPELSITSTSFFTQAWRWAALALLACLVLLALVFCLWSPTLFNVRVALEVNALFEAVALRCCQFLGHSIAMVRSSIVGVADNAHAVQIFAIIKGYKVWLTTLLEVSMIDSMNMVFEACLSPVAEGALPFLCVIGCLCALRRLVQYFNRNYSVLGWGCKSDRSLQEGAVLKSPLGGMANMVVKSPVGAAVAFGLSV